MDVASRLSAALELRDSGNTAQAAEAFTSIITTHPKSNEADLAKAHLFNLRHPVNAAATQYYRDPIDSFLLNLVQWAILLAIVGGLAFLAQSLWPDNFLDTRLADMTMKMVLSAIGSCALGLISLTLIFYALAYLLNQDSTKQTRHR